MASDCNGTWRLAVLSSAFAKGQAPPSLPGYRLWSGESSPGEQNRVRVLMSIASMTGLLNEPYSAMETPEIPLIYHALDACPLAKRLQVSGT